VPQEKWNNYLTTLALTKQIVLEHEGERLKPYTCTAGKLTIGVGRNLTDRGISEDESRFLFTNDLKETLEFLSRKPYWDDLTPCRQAALADLAFCVGASRFDLFKRLHAALLEHDYKKAAVEILDSKFAEQTGTRAMDLADLLSPPKYK
jgi:lysozyme